MMESLAQGVELLTDDTDAFAEEKQELVALVESLDKTCTRNKMETIAEKSKLITNSKQCPAGDQGKRTETGNS